MPASRVVPRLGRFVGALGRRTSLPLFRIVTAPPIARGGHRFATAAARFWGWALGGTERRDGELYVVTGLPKWAFGRGGTTIGATFLTANATGKSVIQHEDVHRQQWERYGLWFAVMYIAAGRNPFRNRFEIEAGLERGGYLPRLPPRGRGRARRHRARTKR